METAEVEVSDICLCLQLQSLSVQMRIFTYLKNVNNDNNNQFSVLEKNDTCREQHLLWESCTDFLKIFIANYATH